MTEDFLHYCWQHRLVQGIELRTLQGQTLEVLHPGKLNVNAGPDFFLARLKLNGQEWFGNVEIHINENDWNVHGHHSDQAYDNVILHVVFNPQQRIKNNNGEELATFDISQHLPVGVWEKYHAFMQSRTWIPCQGSIRKVDDFVVSNWLDRMVIERLMRKAADIDKLLKATNNDWAECFWITLARSFGTNVNREPFEQLARTTPFKQLTKLADDLSKLEAVLFGQSGLLPSGSDDEYVNQLQSEYAFQQKKLRLSPMSASQWKFMRLRPPNFPTVRIAQLADLIHKASSLFSKVLESEKVAHLQELFIAQASKYWDTHYQFGRSGKQQVKRLGDQTIQIILINTTIPLIFVYAERTGKPELKQRALAFLQQLKPEQNAVLDQWAALNLSAENAYRGQALLQLKNEYCSHKRCIHCAIGNNILRTHDKEDTSLF